MNARKLAVLAFRLFHELSPCTTFDEALDVIQSFVRDHHKDKELDGIIETTRRCMVPLRMIDNHHHLEKDLVADLVRDGLILAANGDETDLNQYLKKRRRAALEHDDLARWADALDRVDAGGNYTLLASVVLPTA